MAILVQIRNRRDWARWVLQKVTPQPKPAEENSDPAADRRLVQEARIGHQHALDLLAERLACIPAIVRVRNRALGGPLQPEELDDVAQDCLMIAWRKLDRFSGLSPLESWLYRICALEMMNALRAKRRRHSSLSELVEQAMGQSVDEAAGPVYESQELGLALDQLGPPANEVIRLKHFELKSFVEIAAILDTSINTVKSQYYRGLQKLKSTLQRGRQRHECAISLGTSVNRRSQRR